MAHNTQSSLEFVHGIKWQTSSLQCDWFLVSGGNVLMVDDRHYFKDRCIFNCIKENTAAFSETRNETIIFCSAACWHFVKKRLTKIILQLNNEIYLFTSFKIGTGCFSREASLAVFIHRTFQE